MIPFFSQSNIPIDQDRIERGRPPSRLEVQQHLLDHKRQQYLLSRGVVRQPSSIPFSSPIRSIRHSLGNLLINLGSWMARETATGPNALAR